MRHFLLVVGVCLFFKLQCFASLCFIKLRDERYGLKLSGDIRPFLDTDLLAWLSCTWIACGRGGDGKAASSLLALFQHRFCTDPSAPYKAQPQLSNGVRKGSSWPAWLGGSLTLCRDIAVLLITKRAESKGGKGRGGDGSCYSVAVQFAEGWTGEIFCGCYLVFYLCTTK